MRFEDGMNLLNLAIDQMKDKIVKYLATLSKECKKKLMDHEYAGIKAVH